MLMAAPLRIGSAGVHGQLSESDARSGSSGLDSRGLVAMATAMARSSCDEEWFQWTGNLISTAEYASTHWVWISITVRYQSIVWEKNVWTGKWHRRNAISCPIEQLDW